MYQILFGVNRILKIEFNTNMLFLPAAGPVLLWKTVFRPVQLKVIRMAMNFPSLPSLVREPKRRHFQWFS